MKKPSLKGLNWKQFLVNHGEKLVFGIVALCGLAALGMSRWAPYSEKNPYTLIEDVEKSKEAHKVSTWPEAEQDKFKSEQNIYAKAEKLLSPLDESQFAFSAESCCLGESLLRDLLRQAIEVVVVLLAKLAMNGLQLLLQVELALVPVQ